MTIITHNGKTPLVHPEAFVAPNAVLIGDVSIGAGSSVWFGAILRGDFNKITIGERTNIQDLCLLHTPHHLPLLVGNDVTIGHRAVVHGCTLGSRVLVGMGAIVMNGVVTEDDVLIGAGALVTENTKIVSKSMMLGVPAKLKRELTTEELEWLKKSAETYAENAVKYKIRT